MNDRAQQESAASAAFSLLRGTDQRLLQYSRGLRRGFARGKLGEALREARIRIDGLQHKTREAARSADDAVHHHPYGAIGVAALAGLLVGFLAARR